jgi:hypothetical protein
MFIVFSLPFGLGVGDQPALLFGPKLLLLFKVRFAASRRNNDEGGRGAAIAFDVPGNGRAYIFVVAFDDVGDDRRV